MSDSFFIRPLSAGDTDALRRFYSELPPWIIRWFNPFPQPHAETIPAHLAQAAVGEHISLGLMTEQGAILGHICVRRIHTPRPSLGCGLCEAAIGAGHGRRLMAAALAEADDRNIPLVELTVCKNNPRARHLYESFGFVNIREHHAHEPGDSLMMERLRGGVSGGSVRTINQPS